MKVDIVKLLVEKIKKNELKKEDLPEEFRLEVEKILEASDENTKG